MAKVRVKHRECSRVEVSVSCKNLADVDTFSKSDPFCVLYKKEVHQQTWKYCGRTELIMNNLNPEFSKKFMLDYYFEEKQHIRFEIYHKKNLKSENPKDQVLIGCMETTLGKCVSMCRLEEHISKETGDGDHRRKVNRGEIIITTEASSEAKEEVLMSFKGQHLDKMKPLGKSDPYLEIAREDEDGHYIIVHRTENIKNTIEPTWAQFSITIAKLCNGNYDRKLRIRCYHWKNGDDKLIGEFETTLRDLQKASSRPQCFAIINEERKAKKRDKYTNSGIITLSNIAIKNDHEFMDFIQGGCQIKVVISIDFTASNGDPSKPNSLHYCTTGDSMNQYARAIQAVGEILEDYDSDKMIPAYGFGAIPHGGDEVSHFFPINCNESNPDCEGIRGVFQHYYEIINRVDFSGPTYFAPAIDQVSRMARQGEVGSEYYILLVLTDGNIDDMKETKRAIVEAAKLPISIVIVGIGNEDFSAMNILDGDDVRVSYKKEEAIRDIVQFVAFRDYDSTSESAAEALRKSLAKEVLAEIPDQFVSYMNGKNIKPRNRRNDVVHSVAV